MDSSALLKPSEIKKFKELYEKHHGIKLDSKTAFLKLCLLVRIVEITQRPITNEDLNGNGNYVRTEKSDAK